MDKEGRMFLVGLLLSFMGFSAGTGFFFVALILSEFFYIWCAFSLIGISLIHLEFLREHYTE